MEWPAFDCTGGALPQGITLAPAGNKGLGLFATRSYEQGECVYLFRAALFPADAEVRADTDYGPQTVTVRKHGSGPLTIDYLAGASDAQLAQLAALLGVSGASGSSLLEPAWNKLTRQGRDVYFLTDFDAFVNHAWLANCEYGPQVHELFLWHGRLAGWYEALALRPIASGEELTVNYRSWRAGRR